MPGDQRLYYVALAASAISTIGWLGGMAGVVFTLYFLVTGGPFQIAAVLTVVAVVVGIGFALLEAQLYPYDPEQEVR